jgi:hypothetical protein
MDDFQVKWNTVSLGLLKVHMIGGPSCIVYWLYWLL